MSFIRVVENEDDEVVELPTEGDGTLLLSTLAAQFPGVSGLKYRSETSSLRGVRLADGKLHPPEDDNVWGTSTYICVFPKEEGEFQDVSYTVSHFLPRSVRSGREGSRSP